MYMERIRIGIYDRNPDYARSLAGYFRRHQGEQAEIQVFTEPESLEQAARDGRIRILLADETAEYLCRASPDVKIAVLSENGGGSEPNGTELPRICRYQSADQIWKSLLLLFEAEFLSEHGGRIEETDGKLIGICTPGTDSTGLGLTLTALLSEQGKTLYLTLEEFSSLQTLMGAESPELSELYYYYSQNSLTAARLAASVLGSGSAQMIAPVWDPEDLYREGQLYEPEFFRTLAALGAYQQVILNLGSVSGRSRLFEACRVIVGEKGSPAEAWLEEHGFGEKSRFLSGALIREAGEIRTMEQALHAPLREILRDYLEEAGGIGLEITGRKGTGHGGDSEAAAWKAGIWRGGFR